MIPKLLHIIWIGQESKTPWANIDSWKDKHPDWEFKLWGNKELEEYTWQRRDIIDEYLKYKTYPGVADVMRYQILLDEGGFVAPADSICLHNIEPLLEDHQAIAVYENEKVRPGLISPLYASTPGHDLSKALLNEMHMKYKAGKPRRPVFVTGNHFMKDTVRSRKWQGLKILPSYRFTPIHFTGETYQGNERVYAVQTWGDTTARGKGSGQYEIKSKWLKE